VHTVLLPKDYLRYRLTGDVHTDPSDGSGTLLLDVRRRDWSPDVLAALDIDAAQLPPVQPSTAVAGQLSRQAAAALGLPAGTPVVTGAADTACSALGAGIVDARTLLLTISTGGQIVLPATGVQVDRAGRIHTFCGALPPGPDQAGWYQMAAILSAGMALRWLRDQVFSMPGEAAYARMIAWAEAAPAGAGGLLFLPYLAGERTPHMDPQARGLFLGLAAGHGRAELVRAVLEGVALACYDAYLVLAELGARPERSLILDAMPPTRPCSFCSAAPTRSTGRIFGSCKTCAVGTRSRPPDRRFGPARICTCVHSARSSPRSSTCPISSPRVYCPATRWPG